MNLKLISTLLILLLCSLVYGQNNSIQIKVLTEKDNTSLLGATVYIETIQKGATTDFDGIAVLQGVPDGKYTLQISFVGYETIETQITVPNQSELTFYLHESADALETIVLQSTRSTRTIKNIPTRIEFIGGEELGEKVAMNATNISMTLRESTGIQMQQTSLSSGNSNIRIQGLDGRYTQLLRDGFPLYSGFSSGLSILHIPPVDLKQVEIIKGSSSTLYGGGAIAGLVNLVSKTPEDEPELDIMLTQTQALGSTANAFYSQRTAKWGWAFFGSGNYQKAYDPEDDGFSNLPQTWSINFNPKLFYYPSENTTFWVGLNGSYDDRKGGDIAKIEDDLDGIDQYSEENLSKRISSQVVFETRLDSVQIIKVRNSISFFDRTLEIPDLTFTGNQWNTFTEATYQRQGSRADWVFGANLYSTAFDEDSQTLERDQEDITYGLFINNIYDISERFIIETGLRADYANDWGFFALPRVSLLFKAHSNFSSRIGGGLGYKIPDIFTEEAEFINFEDILPIDKDTLEAERSYGLNLDFNYQTKLSGDFGFSINQLFYITAIKDGLLLNSTINDQFQFENADGEILTKGAETNIKFSYKDFRWFLNYALIDTRLNYLPGNPQKPLTAKHNAGSVFMYESSKWRIGYEAYYTGSQLLSNGTETTDYITMGLLAIRNFKWGNVFVNFENFTDRRQSRFSPLVLPPNEDPIFPEIYAPTDGFIFSLGITLKPFGNESEHHD
ncbi:TonB-dependent receptor [Aquimarina gracilis]|uniref:TonB-dependent receptor n=1 Tax=Aquimarina gracilis TaxID=874422 RepID=A0ABU5ZP08_9FLAO|nr:TonB-dependent receptor [Aquimarina gracilis]MEB3343884.1 TonB-dependent receptor [Aquimarina gracilis]